MIASTCVELLVGEALSYLTQRAPRLEEDVVVKRLESLGYGVGVRLSEKVAQSRPLTAEPLEIVKFVCKDVWTECFGKQVDKLQTDHRGTFVLKDSAFPWLARLGVHASERDCDQARRMLCFVCGLLRGVLTNLGRQAVVRAEYNDEKTGAILLPAVTFTIKINQAQSAAG
jgi:hypothetical protein